MKKTNRTEIPDLAAGLSMPVQLVAFWATLILIVIGMVEISIIPAAIFTIANIILWSHLFKGDCRKVCLGILITEIILLLPMVIVLGIQVLL